MNFRDFLAVASNLAAGDEEAEWRSAVSRAYYAVFHVACELLRAQGFQVPRADRAHAYLWRRLSNCGDASISNAGRSLNELRGRRNEADYDSHRPVLRVDAENAVRLAEELVESLDAMLDADHRDRMVETIKAYERAILKEDTWRP
jgi:uncharacterized protein (UPF0332 family)